MLKLLFLLFLFSHGSHAHAENMMGINNENVEEKTEELFGDYVDFVEPYQFGKYNVKYSWHNRESVSDTATSYMKTGVDINVDINIGLPGKVKGVGAELKLYGQSQRQSLSIKNELVSSFSAIIGGLEIEHTSDMITKKVNNLKINDLENLVFSCGLSTRYTDESRVTVFRNNVVDSNYDNLSGGFSASFFGVLGLNIESKQLNESGQRDNLAVDQYKRMIVSRKLIDKLKKMKASHIAQMKVLHGDDYRNYSDGWKDKFRKQLVTIMSSLNNKYGYYQKINGVNVLSILKHFCFNQFMHFFKPGAQAKLKEMVVTKLYEKSKISCSDDDRVSSSDVVKLLNGKYNMSTNVREVLDSDIEKYKDEVLTERLSSYDVSGLEANYSILNKCESIRRRILGYNQSDYTSVCAGKNTSIAPGSEVKGGYCSVRSRRDSQACLLYDKNNQLISTGRSHFKRHCETGYQCVLSVDGERKRINTHWLIRSWKSVGECVRKELVK